MNYYFTIPNVAALHSGCVDGSVKYGAELCGVPVEEYIDVTARRSVTYLALAVGLQ